MKKLVRLILPYRFAFGLSLISLTLSAVAMGALVATIKPLLDNYLVSGTTHQAKTESQVDRVFSYQKKLLTKLKDVANRMGWDLNEFKKTTELDFENPLPWAVMVLMIFMIQAFFEFIGAYTIGKIGLRIVVGLRQSLMDHISKLSMSFFKEMNTGDIISRVGVDVSRLQVAISVKLGEMIKEAAMATVAVIIIFSLNWQLALTLFILVPMIGGPIVIISRKIRKYSSRSQTFLGQMTAHLKEVLVGVRIVKAFGKEQFESNKLKTMNDSFLKYAIRELKFVTITTPLLGLVGMFIIVGFIIFGSIIIQTTSMSQGDFMVFIIYVYQLYQPIKRMARANSEIQQAIGVLPRIEEILAWENSIPETEDPQRPSSYPKPEAIQFQKIGFWYEDQTPIQKVLDDVSFTVKQGEHIAFVGSSGSGKTTLVNLLPRFFDVCEGGISIDAVDIRNMTKSDLRKLIAVVTQETILFDDTVRNNIAYGLVNVPEEKIIDAAEKAFAHGFIEELPKGYDTILGEAGTRLSGGQKQRISIARAILKEAPILILDEATSALDTESEREVQMALDNLMKEKTSFVIAHRLSTIRNADRILVLDRGKIVEEGTHAQLLKAQGQYFRLEQMQQGGTYAF